MKKKKKAHKQITLLSLPVATSVRDSSNWGRPVGREFIPRRFPPRRKENLVSPFVPVSKKLPFLLRGRKWPRKEGSQKGQKVGQLGLICGSG